MYTFETAPKRANMAKIGRHIQPGKAPTETATKGTKEGEGRKTYLVNLDLANKIDRIAYIERKTVKDVMFDVMGNYVKAYEKKNGPVQ